MYSTRLKNVKNTVFQFINDIESNNILTNVADRIMVLKYLSLISQNKVTDFPYGNKKELTIEKATDYVNTVFKEYSNLDPDFMAVVANLKAVADSTTEPFLYDTSGWDHFIARVGFIATMSGQVENDTKVAAVGVRLLEAEAVGYLDQALTSLIELGNSDPVAKELVEQFSLSTITPTRSSYSILSPFIDKYKLIAFELQNKIDAAERAGSDTYDLKISKGEANTVASMLSRVQDTGDINVRDGYRNTLMHRASYENDLDLARALISCHIDIDAEHCYGTHVLSYAVGNKQMEMIELLLASGASLNFKVSGGESFIEFFEKAAQKHPEFQPLIDKYIPNSHLVNALTTVFGN